MTLEVIEAAIEEPVMEVLLPTELKLNELPDRVEEVLVMKVEESIELLDELTVLHFP